MQTLSIPAIHLNGTASQDLLDPILKAAHSVRAAVVALAETAPNMRDYYVQQDGIAVFYKAAREHEGRMHKLADVIHELQVIGEAITDQQDERRRARS